MKSRKVVLFMMSAVLMGTGMKSYAGETLKSNPQAAKASPVVEKQSVHSVLDELLKLRNSVHVRVVACEHELEVAKRDLVFAIQERDAAKTRADESLRRVETIACLLRVMCETVEINGNCYKKEDVASALARLIELSRTSAAQLTAAERLVDRRTVELGQVAERVKKWQKQEKVMLEQLSALKVEHDAANAVSRAADASKLVAEVTAMLAQNPQAPSALKLQFFPKDGGQSKPVERRDGSSKDAPKLGSSDRLLGEVDSILSKNQANATR